MPVCEKIIEPEPVIEIAKIVEPEIVEQKLEEMVAPCVSASVSEEIKTESVPEPMIVLEAVEEQSMVVSKQTKEVSQPEKDHIDVDSMIFDLQEAKPELRECSMARQQPLQTIQYQPQQIQPMPMYQQPVQMVPQYQQMPQYQQAPMYQQNQNQLAATAMQLQASAMAMQAQASALMMQVQQQPMYAHTPVAQPINRELTKQEKTDQCMHCLRQVVNVGDSAVQRLLLLLDLEFEILEHLLAGNVGKHVERSVQERNSSIKTSLPQIVTAYDAILDLSTTYGSDDTGARLYHYCVRKSKDSNQNSPSHGKKKFLMRVMYELEKYYSMLEKMQHN